MRENPYQSPAAELDARTTRRRARLTRFLVSMAVMLGYNIAMYMTAAEEDEECCDVRDPSF